MVGDGGGVDRSTPPSREQRYEARRALDTAEGPRGPWHALDAGIAHEREWVRFWAQLAGEPD